jgi:hypothetical protein
MSINEYPEKKVQNIWLTDMDDRQPASRIERSDQFETANDVIMKDASVYPKITRRGFAGEEFFLKASKSVPRIGRRNNDIQESPKRSLSKVSIIPTYTRELKTILCIVISNRCGSILSSAQ